MENISTSADLPALLSPREVAEITRQHLSTVYRSLRDGTYPSVKVGRGGVRIPRDLFLSTLEVK